MIFLLIQISMELLFLTAQLLSRQIILHLEKILYFSLEICDTSQR